MPYSFKYFQNVFWASLIAQIVKNPPIMLDIRVQSLGLRTFAHNCPQISADGDCSHDIKRHLLLGRKFMTRLDSIFKSRDITYPNKVRLVKAMVYPVVMYGCESWTVKKAER